MNITVIPNCDKTISIKKPKSYIVEFATLNLTSNDIISYIQVGHVINDLLTSLQGAPICTIHV